MIEYRDYFEIVYFLSAPLLLIASIVALMSIRVSINNIRIRSKREAATVAAEQCKFYTQSIIPLSNKYYLAQKKHNMPSLNLSIKNFEISEFSNIKKELFKEWKSKYILLLHDVTIIDYMNSLEAFSVYFTKGIADEDIGFLTVGVSFCYQVETIYSELTVSRSKKKYYNNVIELYSLWKSKENEIKLKEVSTNLSKQVEDVNSAIRKAQTNSGINPIGVE